MKTVLLLMSAFALTCAAQTQPTPQIEVALASGCMMTWEFPCSQPNRGVMVHVLNSDAAFTSYIVNIDYQIGSKTYTKRQTADVSTNPNSAYTTFWFPIVGIEKVVHVRVDAQKTAATFEREY